jgi:Ca-activated chloride channel family protein
MSRFFQIILVTFVAAALSLAQSGRVKPTESPTPVPNSKPVYQPTQIQINKPTPTPTPKSDQVIEDDDIVRVDSALVPIPVSVTDASGRAVTNLKISDFLLRIDLKDVEIDDLFRSDTPVRLALLFDNSSSVFQAREFEKKAAIRFFKRVLRPDRDLAALYSVASGVRLEQPLTKNTSQLIDAINGLMEPKGATKLLDGIIEASNYLQDFQGRRVIVIVSDGEDNLSDASLEATVKAAQVNNCQIYVVKTTEFENFKRTGERSGSANVRYLAAERRMIELASQTGGAVYSPIDEDELDAAFTRISAELSQQYILSYYPQDDDEKRGEFREIAISVKNGERLTVRTRKGYYVPKRLNR